MIRWVQKKQNIINTKIENVNGVKETCKGKKVKEVNLKEEVAEKMR